MARAGFFQYTLIHPLTTLRRSSMKRLLVVAVGGILYFLLVIVFLSTNTGCNSDGKVVHDTVNVCQRAFVFWHVQFMPPPTDEIPKLFLENTDGDIITSDESGGGGLPCAPPASCGESFSSNGIAPGTYHAYVSYRGQKYYYTAGDDPVTIPGNTNAATIEAVGGKSYVLKMVVKP